MVTKATSAGGPPKTSTVPRGRRWALLLPLRLVQSSKRAGEDGSRQASARRSAAQARPRPRPSMNMDQRRQSPRGGVGAWPQSEGTGVMQMCRKLSGWLRCSLSHCRGVSSSGSMPWITTWKCFCPPARRRSSVTSPLWQSQTEFHLFISLQQQGEQDGAF